MSKIQVVDINDPEFVKRVLEIMSQHSPVAFKNSRFIRLPDGGVKDLQLGIEWGPSSEKEMNHQKATEYAVQKGGRLPSLKELHSLVDYDKDNPAIDKEVFPDTKSSWYWTNTKTSWNKEASWVVGFYYGGVFDDFENNVNYVRPVRVSQ